MANRPGPASRRPRPVALVLAALVAAAAARADEARPAEFAGTLPALAAPRRLASALAQAEARLTPHFDAKSIPYPPPAAAFVALKEEGRLELWAQMDEGWRFVRSYLIRATSGRLGPKLRQGDRQVPEGVYRISALNPNSRYHLSMRLDYPNAFDRARAADEGRTDLGGDIMIHGNRVSIGCIPVGDVAVEELFALAARLGPRSVRVVVSPLDLRRAAPAEASERAAEHRPWLGTLYGSIARELTDFPLPREEAAPVATLQARERRPRLGILFGSLSRLLGFFPLPSVTTPRATVADAWTLHRLACEAGDASECAELARLHVADHGLRRDVARAAALAVTACDAGEGRGCAVLVRLCSEGLLYPGGRARCTPERLARAAEVERAVCRGACEAPFEAARPVATVR